MQELSVRRAEVSDLPRIMRIYAHAREFMAAHGNPRQWGATGWPPESLIRSDIAAGKCYVCVAGGPAPDDGADPSAKVRVPAREPDGGRVVGTFFYDCGTADDPEVDPSYRHIEDGAWVGEAPYGVVHRIASDGSRRGVGSFCIGWAYDRCGHLRMDTHPDNVVMQGLLGKLGFRRCGIIHVPEDDDPRLAYEKF